MSHPTVGLSCCCFTLRLSSFRLLNELLQTRWLPNSRNLLLVVLEGESSRTGCQHGWVRAIFWVSDFSVHPYMGKVARDLPGATSLRYWSHPGEFHPNDLSTSEGPHQIILSELGVSILTYEFGVWGHKHSGTLFIFLPLVFGVPHST